MPFVTYSETPLSFDTLPAVKVYHYRNCAEEEMVYSYLKLFADPEGLHLSFSIFEQAPAAESRAALTLCGAGKSRAYLPFAAVTLSAKFKSACTHPAAQKSKR